MNAIRNAALGSLAAIKEAATQENLHAGMMAATDKGRELAEAAPGVSEQVREREKNPPTPLPKPTSPS